MGIFNKIFGKNKKDEIKLLEAGQQEERNIYVGKKTEGQAFNERIAVDKTSILSTPIEQKEVQNVNEFDPDLRVFSRENRDNGKLEYNIIYEATSESPVVITSILEDKITDISLKTIVSGIRKVMKDAKYETEKGISEEKVKKEMQKQLDKLTPYIKGPINLDGLYDLSNISENNGYIDYRKIFEKLPKIVDVKALTSKELVNYNSILAQRMEELGQIKTPEEAYKSKNSLESFMKSQEEKPSLESVIIETNLEHLSSPEEKPLDLDTIISLTKNMEGVKNEDGLLYSTYLKFEENRIIRKIQKEIQEYQSKLDISEVNKMIEAQEQMEYLEDTQIGSFNIQDMENVQNYIVKAMRGENISTYSESTIKKDIKLINFLQRNPIKNTDEAKKYLTSRISCLGQVADVPPNKKFADKIQTLRKYIETTDYKDEDYTDSQNFLYFVSNIERDYIEKNFSPILNEAQKNNNKQER